MNASRFHQLFLALLAVALVSAAGCKKDDDGTQEENITTVVLHLTGPNGFDAEYEWNDLDGAGGNDPVVDNLLLTANTVYTAHVHVYDRSKTPADDLTNEIEAEADSHLFTFTPSGTNVTVTYEDEDNNGKPLGIETKWTTGATSFGTVTLRLFHEPTNKDNLSSPGGETDIEATFSVRVQ